MTSIEIASKRKYFTKITWNHLRKCFIAYENKEYSSAGIWASVFCESLIKDFLQFFNVNHNENSDLESLKGKLKKQIYNDPNIINEDKPSYNAILRRMSDIQLKRNRLVHDTGMIYESIESDVEDMVNSVKNIIDIYLGTTICCAIHDSLHPHRPLSNDSHCFSVFLSINPPCSFEQSEFIENLRNNILDLGIIPECYKPRTSDKEYPVDEIIKIINECQMLIAVNLAPIPSKDPSIRSYDRKKEDIKHHYTPAWTIFECGIAAALRKNILILCQEGTYNDGIFDNEWNKYKPLELETPLNIHDQSINKLMVELLKMKKSHE